MGKGAPLRWLESRFLRRHLRGLGIEIGALWRRFPVPPNVRVWHVDRSTLDGLEKHYPDLKGKIIAPDLIAEATQLPVAPASLDFLIASHVLEHLPFPLLALRVWYEALAPGGVLLIKVPDKRHTFDFRRFRTPLAHLLAEYQHPELFDSRTHYADWVENVDRRRPGTPEFDAAVQALMGNQYSIHFHVWTDDDVREIIEFTRQVWRLKWQPLVFWGAHFYRKEAVVLLARHE